MAGFERFEGVSRVLGTLLVLCGLVSDSQQHLNSQHHACIKQGTLLVSSVPMVTMVMCVFETLQRLQVKRHCESSFQFLLKICWRN